MKKSYSYICRLFLISYFLFFISYLATAQWYDPLKVKTKATDIYLQSISKAQNGDLSSAIKIMLHSEEINPDFNDTEYLWHETKDLLGIPEVQDRSPGSALPVPTPQAMIPPGGRAHRIRCRAP